jgi:hypothetical protein
MMRRSAWTLVVVLWLSAASLAPAQLFNRQPPLPGPVVDTSNLATPLPEVNMKSRSGFSFLGLLGKLNPFRPSQSSILPQKPRTTLPAAEQGALPTQMPASRK